MVASFKHGPYGYTNHACRCEVCKVGHRLKQRETREVRYAQRVMHKGRLIHLDANHGVYSSYTYYGCRCLKCIEANTIARRKYRRK